MKFSIIVPVYKVEDYIGQCVESIMCQDFDDFELILVDDGSPDNCPKICDEYAKKHERIKAIHKKNGGLSDARNCGINAAQGDYICFVDSDDFWGDSSALTKLDEVLCDNKFDIVQYGVRKYWQREDKYEELSQINFSYLNGMPTGEVLEKLVSTGKLLVSAYSMSISRQFLLEHNLYFKKGIKSEDIEWAFRLFSACPRLAFLNESFYIYRLQRQGSITTVIDYKPMCDCCDIIEDSLIKIDEGSDELKKPLLSFLMYQLLTVMGLVNYVELKCYERKEILRRLKVIAEEHLLNNTLEPKVKLISKAYRLLGFRITAKILGFYLKYR